MRRITMSIAVAIILATGAAPAAPLTNDDAAVGFLSGFWMEEALTMRLNGCAKSGDRNVCVYNSRNSEGVTAVFGSDTENGPVNYVAVTADPGADRSVFVQVAVTMLKALNDEWHLDERRSLLQRMMGSTATGPAKETVDGVTVTVADVGTAVAFEARR